MIWIETLSRNRDTVVARQRCDGEVVSVGRAYDNDVVIDDPFVAPHHLRIFRDGVGTLVAEDQGTVNGAHGGDGEARESRIALDGDRVLRIGRTLLRVRGSDFTVPPERVAGPLLRTWPLACALVITVLAFEVLSLWLSETGEPQPSRYLLPVLATVLLILGWAAVWAVVCRIFAGHARCARHLVVALAGLTAIYLLEKLIDYGSFSLSLRSVAEYGYVAAWLILAGVCGFHLYEIGPAHLKLKIGAVAGLALVAIVAQTIIKSETSSQFGQQSYLPALKPPLFRLKRPQPADVFFGETQKIKAEVDKARLKPPPGEGLFSGLFDADD